MSSLSFAGTTTSNLVIPYSTDLDFGTGDFTIEWYQYQINNKPNARVFSRGAKVVTPPTSNPLIGVSIEFSNFYVWPDTNNKYISNNLRGQWNHFAVTRSSGITTAFMNGISIISFNDSRNYTQNLNLTIGNESTILNNSSFTGYMTYFAWNKGYARYTTNFTVSNTYPPILPSTVLMLSAYNNFGLQGEAVVNSNVSTFATLPPGFDTRPQYTPPPTTFLRIIKPFYSDNTKVYKPHSLASSIGSTVINSRAVARRT